MAVSNNIDFDRATNQTNRRRKIVAIPYKTLDYGWSYRGVYTPSNGPHVIIGIGTAREQTLVFTIYRTRSAAISRVGEEIGFLLTKINQSFECRWQEIALKPPQTRWFPKMTIFQDQRLDSFPRSEISLKSSESGQNHPDFPDNRTQKFQKFP